MADIFIWGIGQSGTFLIFDILNYSLPMHRSHCSKLPRKKGLCHDSDITKRLGITKAPQEGMTHFWKDFFYKKCEKEYRETCKPNKSHYSKPIISMAITKLKYLIASRNQTYSILDKCPNYANTLPLINAIFPEAFHIHVVRDPRYAIQSQILRLRPNSSIDLGVNIGYESGYYGNIYEPNWPSHKWPDKEKHAFQNRKILEASINYARKNLNFRVMSFENFIKYPLHLIDELQNWIPSVEINRRLFTTACDVAIDTSKSRSIARTQSYNYYNVHRDFFNFGRSDHILMKINENFPKMPDELEFYKDN